jgi:HEPN domain-containing protein
MPRRPGFTGKPDDWLRRAKGNLARAKQTKPKDAFWEDLCFDAQQAAEKAIKAVLVSRDLEFRKTHDLREPFNPVEFQRLSNTCAHLACRRSQ